MPATRSEAVPDQNAAFAPQSAKTSGGVSLSGMRLFTFVGLTLLPWFAAVLGTAGISAAIHLVLYVVLVSVIGYGMVSAAALAGSLETAMVAPALGITAICALGALWLRLGLSVRVLPYLWIGLGLACLPLVWRNRSRVAGLRSSWGWSVAALSALICLIFFLPAARHDAVQHPDGSFSWIYVDTQHFYAIAAALRSGPTPPVGPGSATELLEYHFGAYVPAAAISRFDGLNLGDALMRVTRGASMWALILSCFGLGTMLARRAFSDHSGGERFGGLMSVAGLFFYGSLLSLFSNETNSTSPVTGAILFRIPGIEVTADGGPFSHLILGHSELHGLVAITSVLALCLASLDLKASFLRRMILLLLPAMVAPVNSVSALYCLGIAGLLLSWGRLRTLSAWIEMLLMTGLFLGAWHIMGFAHAPEAGIATLNRHPGAQWWIVVVGFLVGLGFRIVAFSWIRKPLRDPVAAMVLASVIGLLSFFLLLRLGDGNQHYGVYFLDCMLSIFAFARLRYGFWRPAELRPLMRSWFGIAAKGMLLLTAIGLGLVALTVVTHHHSGVKSFPLKLAVCSVTVLVLFAGTALLKQQGRGAIVLSRAAAVLLLVGFLAWIAPWLNFGLGRMKMEITIPAAEVYGLRRLEQLAPADQRFATNQHDLAQIPEWPERSYVFSALSEHPVLLEGYRDRGVMDLSWFPAMLHDNDEMFATTDPEALRSLASHWQVRWLVARPGTDISLPRPLPAWLVPQTDTGSLKIYRIN